jgi:hypothetical protein
MIQQVFKAGQKVRHVKMAPANSDSVYTVISAEPVFKPIPIRQRLMNISKKQPAVKEIVNFKYRCKSREDMKDFLQEELIGV